jgi:two-component system OmpR family sensor kinase
MRSGFRLPDLSLRVRLLLALIALAAIGLATLDIVSYRALNSYLLDRVDQQLESAVGPVSVSLIHKLDPEDLPAGLPRAAAAQGGSGGGDKAVPPVTGVHGGGGDGGGPDGPPAQLPPGTYGQLRGSGGAILKEALVTLGESNLAEPAIPASLSVTRHGASPEPFTVGQKGGGSSRFRVVAVRDPRTLLTTVVAVPLTDTQATLDRLALIELIVSAAILVALALIAWWLVRVGLAPLRRMEAVAGDIAAGDLSRRVEPANERTEVGRLGLALNAMLAQIEQAFAEREAGEQRLRQFLADASHELRTPLAGIRGYAELYRLGASHEPDQVERAMGRIEAEATRMAGLVDDLLTLARVDEVREPVREPVDLDALLVEVCEDTRAAAPERRILLDVPKAAVVEANSDQLRRVFANLLRNAVVHTPPETPIEASLAVDGQEAVVRVRDHGPGLPDGDPRAVFERFWRSSASRGRDDGGAGLGLAIVAAIVRAHGGSVEAADAASGGAEFIVRLPLLPQS